MPFPYDPVLPFQAKETIVKVWRGGKANEQVIYFLLPTAASPSFLSLFEAQIIIVAINCIARGSLSSSSPSTAAVNPNRRSIKRPFNGRQGDGRHVPLFDLLRQNGNTIAVVSE